MSKAVHNGVSIKWPDHAEVCSGAANSCHSCRKPRSKATPLRVFGFDSGTGAMQGICDDCYAVKFTRCQSCGNSTYNDLLYNGWCKTCVEKAPTILIRKYSYKVSSEPIGDTENRLWFGVELELESKGDYGRDTLDVHSLLGSFAVLKRDASITRGFEVVTRPATLAVHKEKWRNILSSLPATACADLTCGMHVHVSRNTLWGISDLQIGKILTFIHAPENSSLITILAGRPSSHHNNFTKPKCLLDGRAGGMVQADMDRHTAVNCNNTHTLEFRIFQSVTDYDIFAKNLEFCDAMLEYTAPNRFSLLEYRNPVTFCKFVFDSRKNYRYLHKFLLAHPSAKSYHDIATLETSNATNSTCI